MRLVRFLVNHQNYMSGEQAGFDDAVAEGLVNAGKAVWPDDDGDDGALTLDLALNVTDLPKYQEALAALTAGAEEVARREAEVSNGERALNERADKLSELESEAADMRKNLNAWRDDLTKRSAALDARDDDVAARERALAEAEEAFAASQKTGKK